MKILYKASKDGFDSSIFHEKCDNQGKTLTIIKSEFHEMFGGYTDLNLN